MNNLELLSLRELQKESARALSTMQATNHNISKFNKEAHHNSQKWYKAVILWYINEYGDLPSRAGPGKDVILFSEK
jgi:transcriptional regulator